MDGGRRLLQPVNQGFSPAAGLRPAVAGYGMDTASTPAMLPILSRRRQRRPGFFASSLNLLNKKGAGWALTLMLMLGTGAYGAVRGGHYDSWITQNGAPADILARGLGLGLKSITISGQRELSSGEILEVAGISELNSLLFLDAQNVRERLRTLPLIKDADVHKLYPDRLMIDIAEREPFALWQKDGQVMLISAEGTVIDVMRDQRFATLPFVVGDGAEMRVGEFIKILDANPDMRDQIRAGVLVAQRRWNLKLNSGIDIKLPEANPAQALAGLTRLEREGRLLGKDIVSVDLRMPGRAVVRLSEDAANARAEAQARKNRGKGGTT
jgi:cell division protein FtsQ